MWYTVVAVIVAAIYAVLVLIAAIVLYLFFAFGVSENDETRSPLLRRNDKKH